MFVNATKKKQKQKQQQKKKQICKILDLRHKLKKLG